MSRHVMQIITVCVSESVELHYLVIMHMTHRRRKALAARANKVLSIKYGLLPLVLPSMQKQRERLCLLHCHANLLSMSLLIKHTSEDCNPPDVFLISIRFPALAF